MPQLVVNENGEIHHSEEIDDIITATPGWILRWGILTFLAALVIFLGLAAVIRYPDIIKAPVKIIGTKTPKAITAKVNGRVEKILVIDNQMVKQGQVVAFMESTADHSGMLHVRDLIRQIQQQYTGRHQLNMGLIENLDGFSYGELQDDYEKFSKDKIAYKAVIASGIAASKLKYLSDEAMMMHNREQQVRQQIDLMNSDLKITAADVRMHRSLLEEKAETLTEYRNAEGQLTAKKANILQLTENLTAIQSGKIEKDKERTELKNQMQEQEQKFIQALNSLQSTISNWIVKYVLIATQAGKISFINNIQPLQEITLGQEIFYINANDGQFMGEIRLPQYNMGRVRLNQQVLIKLHSYPFEQYGMLSGRIARINDLPEKDSLFIARVSFKSSSAGGRSSRMDLKQGMLGNAEVVTDDNNVLGRIFNSVRRASGTR